MYVSRSVVSELCDPTDCSPPGSSVRGILQARILEWVAISFSKTGLRVLKIKSFRGSRFPEVPLRDVDNNGLVNTEVRTVSRGGT